ncbi:unnamed protein product [Thelazia callipaeda]|uniref:NPH3 domain-containing protein n=1 Tax=Thelazia callipaeda TaxID=103827 RepID=A0A0N5CKL9_THECL|nr:unnamed protein product [Thelazia callipaeda]
MNKQRKLEEALRMGVDSRRHRVDMLLSSTVDSLLNHHIEFSPATITDFALQNQMLKCILLEPENEIPAEQCGTVSDSRSKQCVTKDALDKLPKHASKL